VRITQEPGGVLVFLPGQDDIEALQSLLEENLPNIVGQQYEETLEKGSSAGGSVIVNSNKGLVGGVTVKKGILKDFEIWPLYAAMPPEEQVSGERFKVHGFDRLLTHSAVLSTLLLVTRIQDTSQGCIVLLRLISVEQ
jgi:HrpA-like RNA helicase